MEKNGVEVVTITQEEVGERLDTVLAERFREGYSRAYFQNLIDREGVLLNGQLVKKGSKLRVGDVVEVRFSIVREVRLVPEAIPLEIVYEDQYLLVVNKPAGMVVHPAPGSWSGTFVHALLHHCQQLAIDPSDGWRPGIVHRLDKETSGLLVAAKTSSVQRKLVSLFASRQVYKEYWAVCVGKLMEGEINAPIGRHPIRRKEMAVTLSGRQALSVCTSMGWNGQLSLVRVVIATGRTHQIRVHLKYKGTPVLGDSVYGDFSANRRYGVHRQLLHAAVMKFRHPVTQESLEFKASAPLDMRSFISSLSGRR